MKYNTAKRVFSSAALFLAMVCIFTINVFAQEASGEGAVLSGLYRHPVSGAIEDSGGESSEALGQSMVNSVVDPQALLETASDGTLYLSFRFHLMSNISDVNLAVQKPDETQWTEVAYESIAKAEDSEDIRIPVPARDAIVRAECKVDAMGRYVVFYMTADQFTAGSNPGNFVRMDADHVPSNTTESSKVSSTAPAPEKVEISAPVPNTGKDGEVVGLVTGGTPAAPAPSGAQTAPRQEDSREVIVSTGTWVMFFVLVFCAQLLACFAFWGLKTLFEKTKRRDSEPFQVEIPFDDEENQDEEFADDDWMELNHED